MGLDDHRFCFQSAAPTPEPWLGPDIVDYLQELHGEGVRYVLSVPFGFVAEHLEVLWDIDTEAQAIDYANRGQAGLAAYLYTRDADRMTRVSEALEYGMVGVNTGLISTEVAPFGEIGRAHV